MNGFKNKNIDLTPPIKFDLKKISYGCNFKVSTFSDLHLIRYK